MYILLTGGTGVGKSSVMEYIALQDKTIKMFSDPFVNNPFISDAYTTKKMVCQSQMFFMKEFLKIHKNINFLHKKYNIIQERSIYECVHVFCRTFQKQGKIDHNEFELLKDFLNILQPELRLPDIIVYLTASPLIIEKRVELRSRVFENSIDLTFIESQQFFYMEWLSSIQSQYDIPVLRIENDSLPIDQVGKTVYGLFNKMCKKGHSF